MAWVYTLTFQDAYGRLTRRTVDLGAADYTNAAIAATAFLADVQAATNLAVVQEQLTEVTQIASVPAAGSNIDEGATLSFSLGGIKKAVWKLPSPVAAMIQSDGTVLLSATETINLAANFISGDVLISDGETAVSLLKGTLDK